MNSDKQMLCDLLSKRYKGIYLSKAQVCRELGVGLATLDRMRDDGEIKSVKIRGSVRIPVTEITKFIED